MQDRIAKEAEETAEAEGTTAGEYSEDDQLSNLLAAANSASSLLQQGLLQQLRLSHSCTVQGMQEQLEIRRLRVGQGFDCLST